MTRPLENLTSVVTGSSSGIGQAIATSLAHAGASVLIHARSNRDGAEETRSMVQNYGVESRVILADLAIGEELEKFADDAWAWQNGVDIWVNNAGADILTGGAVDFPFERRLDQLWQTDVLGTIRLSRLVGHWMQKAGSGSIVNIGWDGAERGMAGSGAELFATAKGAVMAFTRSLAQSLAPQVRVNCIAPGWIKTAWGEVADETWQKRAETESLMRRWGTPDDVANAVCFLVDPNSSFITDQTIMVNGGFRRL
ncbi:MAG: SDR family oxidoreductase [Planctomycetia bacterium]|jgi:3-oxoacyl-[acyl-carrier protein] reductase